MTKVSIEEIMEGFEFLDDWEDRYAYLIDLGKSVEGLGDEQRVEERGGEVKVTFRGDSDAHIVRGLVSVLLSAYTDKTPSEIIAVDIEALFKRMGLENNLSVSRRNGFFSMVERVKGVALRLM